MIKRKHIFIDTPKPRTSLLSLFTLYCKEELHLLCTYAMLKNVNTLYIIRRNLSPFNVPRGSQLCMVREAQRGNSRDL